MTNPLYDGLFGVHTGKSTPFLHLQDGRVITHDEFLTTGAQIAHVTEDTWIEARRSSGGSGGKIR